MPDDDLSDRKEPFRPSAYGRQFADDPSAKSPVCAAGGQNEWPMQSESMAFRKTARSRTIECVWTG